MGHSLVSVTAQLTEASSRTRHSTIACTCARCRCMSEFTTLVVYVQSGLVSSGSLAHPPYSTSGSLVGADDFASMLVSIVQCSEGQCSVMQGGSGEGRMMDGSQAARGEMWQRCGGHGVWF